MTQHLTHEQLCDVLLDAPAGTACDSLDTHRQHLGECLICASELDLLSGSVSRLRASSVALAEHELSRRRLKVPLLSAEPRTRGYFSQPLLWAGASFVFAVSLPLGMHFYHTTPSAAAAPVNTSAQSTESDEALLEGINQDLDAAIPTSMEPLADPTAGATKSQPSTPQRKN